ncbi:MAG: hypothetical protein R6X02_07505 [Enhygromyxa sp.]
MYGQFDPRSWNLLTGLALLSAGCGARVAGQEAGDTGETADTTPEGSECVNSSDCPVGYGCYDGQCMYYPHHDGWIPYDECYSDDECAQFEICRFGYCTLVDPPPGDCSAQGLALPVPLPLELDGEALALSFADLDEDGQDELVIATESELLVYGAGDMIPSASLREPGPISDMVAGSFDLVPGEDVILLIDEALVLHGSNGDGSFATATTTLPPLGSLSRLLAAELDAAPPTDLIGWGGLGVFIEREGEPLVISEEQVEAGAVHPFGSPEPSFALRRGSSLDIYGLDGEPLGTSAALGGPPVLAALRRGSAGEYVGLVPHSNWSVVTALDPNLSAREWAIEGTPEQVFAGDLLGDEDDELVFIEGAILAIEFDPGGPADCWHELPMPPGGLPSRVVFGDHDGDGKQEMAVLTDAGEVVWYDGG